MTDARLATTADTDELVRLRGVILSAIHGGEDVSGPWEENAARLLREWLGAADSGFAAFVVERPDEPGRLASCAAVVIHRFLSGPANPAGKVAYVYNVVTDAAYRRRGYSRACMEAIVDWCRGQGIPSVDLHASTEAEPLYRSMGFVQQDEPAMHLTI